MHTCSRLYSIYITSLERHSWLLSEEVDLLPVLLLPLAGPEEFEDQDTEKFPLDLQYLPDDKTREEDPSIRKMLVEALMQVIVTFCEVTELVIKTS